MDSESFETEASDYEETSDYEEESKEEDKQDGDLEDKEDKEQEPIYNVIEDATIDLSETATEVKNKEDRITKPVLTKYEMVRLLGIRAKQIALGAVPLIKGIDELTPTKIAVLELEHNVLPFKIKRRLPNNKYEIWDVRELEKIKME